MMKNIFPIIVLLFPIILMAQVGKPKLILPRGQTNSVLFSIFSNDDKYIISGSSNGVILFRSKSSGEEIDRIKLPYAADKNGVKVLNYQVSPSKNFIVFWAKANSSIQIFDLKSKSVLKNIYSFPNKIPQDIPKNDGFPFSGIKTTEAYARDYVKDVIISNDESSIFAITQSGINRLWKLGDEKLKHFIIGHIQNACFSKDDKNILTAISWYGGNVIYRLYSSVPPPNTIKYKVSTPNHKDNKVIDKKQQVYLPKIELLPILESNPDSTLKVNKLEITHDGKLFISAQNEGNIKIFSLISLKKVYSFKAHTDQVTILNLHPKLNLFLTGSYFDEQLKFWDYTGKLKYDIKTDLGILNTEFSKSGNGILTCDLSGKVKLWDYFEGELLRNFDGIAQQVLAVEFSPNSENLVVSMHDSTKRIINFKSKNILRSVKGTHILPSNSLPFPNCEYIFLCENKNFIQIWDVKKDRLKKEIKLTTQISSNVAFSKIGNSIAFGTNSNQLVFYDVDNDSLTFLKYYTSKIIFTQFSQDSLSILSCSMDSLIVMRDVKSLKIRNSIKFNPISFNIENINQLYIKGDELSIYFKEDEYSSNVLSLDLNTKKFISTGSTDSKYGGWGDGLYSSQNNLNLFVRKYHLIDELEALARQNEIDIFDYNDYFLGKPKKKTLKGHEGIVTSFDFSMNGEYLVSTSSDHTIKFWDVKNGKEIATLILSEDGSWAVVDSSGRFDAPIQIRNKLYLTQNGNVFSLEQLENKYENYGLLSHLLGLSSEKGNGLRTIYANYQIPLPPKISNMSIINDYLSITLKNNGFGIGSVILKYGSISLPLNVQNNYSNKSSVILKFNLGSFKRFLDESNRYFFSVTVLDSSNIIQSQSSTIRYISKSPIEPVAGESRTKKELPIKVYGLFIGNNINLSYSSRDARTMYKVLFESAKKLYGEKNVEMILLTSESTIDSLKPTKTNILKFLKYFIPKAKSNDIFEFYYSGHGKGQSENNGDFFFFPYDISYGDMPYLFDKQNSELNKKLVSMRQITTILNQIAAQKKILIIDACDAAAAIDVAANVKDVISNQEYVYGRVQRETGTFFLVSSERNQSSFEDSKLGYSVLTYNCLKQLKRDGLKKYSDDKKTDYFIEVGDWFSKVSSTVNDMSEDRDKQSPKYSSTSLKSEGNFIVGQIDNDISKNIEILQKPLFSGCFFHQDLNYLDPWNLKSIFDNKLNAMNRDPEAFFAYTSVRDKEGVYEIRGNYILISAEKIKLNYEVIYNNNDVFLKGEIDIERNRIEDSVKVILFQIESQIIKNK